MEKAGIKELPKTWAEFNADCDKAVAAKLICLAHFSQDWTDATTFEVVVYGQDIDSSARHSSRATPTRCVRAGMVKAFEQFRLMVSKYMDPAIAGRDYQTATDMIAKNQAVFMIMGDWQIGIFSAAGLKAGGRLRAARRRRRIGASRASSSIRIRSSSSSRRIPTTSRARSCWRTSSCRRSSRRFSTRPKARFPARLDVDLSKGFNPCQQLSQKDLQASIADGTLVRSMAHNMTILQKYRGAIMEVITTFVNNAQA